MNKILVVEEKNEELREAIVRALADESFEVASSRIYDVIRIQEEFKPDLIVLGYGLPVDNCEACDLVRHSTDALILMLGIAPCSGGWTKAVEAGADFYLAEPFSYKRLVTVAKAMLRRSEISHGRMGIERTNA